MTPYYADDLVTIYHARCEDVLPGIDPATVDLLLTDPPYGINLEADYTKLGGGNQSHVVHRAIEGDAETFNPAHLMGFGRTVLWGANNYPASLPPGGWFVWQKSNPHPRASECELAWTNLTRRVSSFRSIRPGTGRPAWHPSEKPVALMAWIIDRWTEPGDLVLDPYMGSGPIAQACHELGRRYIGVELVEDYCRIAVSRLSQQTFDFGGVA